VLSWGNNAHSQCGVPAAELGFITHPERVQWPVSGSSLLKNFAVQVSFFFYSLAPPFCRCLSLRPLRVSLCRCRVCVCVVCVVVCVCARAHDRIYSPASESAEGFDGGVSLNPKP
jgi:hypothetical protein